MGWREKLRAALGREARDAEAWADEVGTRWDAGLSRRERELAMTPEEQLEASIRSNEDDDPLAAVRERIAGQQARAAAHEELAASEEPAGGEPEVVDAELVEDDPPDARG